MTESAFPSPRPAADASTFGAGLRRTLRLLAQSTPQRRNTVKIVVYGQSLSKQNWWRRVAEQLRARFPHANLDMRNLAVGGFDAGMLVDTVVADLLPLYPDLVILHAFGGDPDYEALVRTIRTQTTAELVLQNDHVSWLPTGEGDDPAKLKGYAWHEEHSLRWMPDLARRYGCELADVRTAWKQYLADHRLKPTDLMGSDGSHYNDHGNFLLAELLLPHLTARPAPAGAAPEKVHDHVVGRDVRWRNGALELEFSGNRIEAIAQDGDPRPPGSAEVWIDGRRPSAFPELYAVTRANGTAAADWPWSVGAMYRVMWNTPLALEDWTATITRITDDLSDFDFEVYGSVTGPDGRGTRLRDFVSPSGRVVIPAKFWHLARAHTVAKLKVGPGYAIRWSVIPMFADVFRAPAPQDPAIERTTVLASGLANGPHTLRLAAEAGGLPPIRAIRVFTPMRAPG